MAFADGTFVRLDTGSNSDAGKMFVYKEAATLAAMRASGYFNDAASSYGLADADVIFMNASDGIGFSLMDVTAGVATVVGSITSS